MFILVRITTKATTLIEILFYFAILGIVLSAAMTFAFQIIFAGSRSADNNEIQSNANVVFYQIEKTIRMAEAVDSSNSIFNSDEGYLVLLMKDPLLSPTQFYLEEGIVWERSGASNPIQLSDPRVYFDRLSFQHVTYPKNPDQIRINARISTASQIREELMQVVTRQSAISLRSF
ncbi:MAG: hypothetical protein ACD_28C00300G0006 [uncultured bacterium]|nr:MAG: hypothetical protein ACD_28C00300G0006 [uncultured bacterium]KKT76737.1 MAG: hypothetical protein UW70_C0014G0003 [Candidatus Peregrinibacteria bacterium GW2011_GWA2_44_7]